MSPVTTGLGGPVCRLAWLETLLSTLLLLAVFVLFQIALLFMGDEA